MTPRFYASSGAFLRRAIEVGIRSGRDLAAAVLSAGFDGLEINPNTLDAARSSGIQLSLSDLHGIGLSLHSDFLDFSLASPNPYVREAAVRQLCDEMKIAAEHSMPTLTFHPGRVRRINRWKAMELFWESLHKVVEQNPKVQLCLENMDDKDEKLCNRFEELSETLNRFPTVFLTADLAHLGLRKQNIDEFIDLFGTRIAHAHISGVIPGTPHGSVSLERSQVNLLPYISRLARRDIVFVIENGPWDELTDSLRLLKRVFY